jgi:hypothetical protein
MTSQGSPISRLHRAIASGNSLLIVSAAHEVGGRLDLPEALAVTLAYLEHDPDRYGRVAVRWLARLAERAPLDVPHAHLVLAALDSLQTGSAGAAEALAALLGELGEMDCAEVLERWATR